MHHDPERFAAYLAGELTAHQQNQFEQHLLTCETCWRETHDARAGRLLAESLRETAPPVLRERIRAIATLPPAAPPAPSPRRRNQPPSLLLTAAAAIALLMLLLPSGSPSQPTPLAAAADLYHSATPQPSPGTTPPLRRIADYTWRGSSNATLGGIPATIHTYTAQPTRKLLVLTSTRPFPRAPDASDITPAPSWIADLDGTTMLCADTPGTSWLAIAPNRTDALTAGKTLGITHGST
ncbi:anti-sigma factor family protein [Amycolatopsis aidingensis]|uniref:anti-sigma factor family protein n=1 Tax=Amycolatopsis aidingensis TaxID=2842453 RepID=UPI001C0C2B6D|nr:zf-HC2 domain-containing protein [Amycolatopsis aidingensis]